MTDFEQRMQKAVERGQRRSEERAQEARAKALSAEELKRLHTDHRLALSEHIERCIESLPHHFPGFQYETIFGESGWGAGASRDDVGTEGGRRKNFYSRLEMTIRPFTSLHVLELVAKGTVRNKELFNRTHFEKLDDADPDTFRELIDVWTLEYAELFAARS
jgi:hypothetical protein